MNNTSIPDWLNLPNHLIAYIAKHIRTRIDILRFRATCHTFRISASFPPPKPLFPDLTPLRLRESTLYAIEPLHKIDTPLTTAQTWVIRVEESESDSQLKIRVIDPLSGSRFENLPNKLPKKLNLLDYRVKEISKLYQLLGEAEFDGVHNVTVDKVVVLTCIDGFVAVMALTSEDRACVKRTGDDEWTHIDIGPEDPHAHDWIDCVDIVTHNGKFYAFGCTGRTITVDCKSLNVYEVAHPPWLFEPMRFAMRIVKSVDGLYMIDRWEDHFDLDDDFIYLKGFKLDEKKHRWDQVSKGVEDIAFFVGLDCSFSLSSKEFPGCKGNCLYFIDRYYVERDYPGSDVEIFDFEERIVGLLSAYSGYSKIFWPPPTWLKQNSSSKYCPRYLKSHLESM